MIKLAIVGYGNLGKGVEAAVRQNPDMELVAVFTRRDPERRKRLFPDSRNECVYRSSLRHIGTADLSVGIGQHLLYGQCGNPWQNR